ncbi:MAG TPA: hypothetical protein VIY48_17570 [Candidatus Paceibacterota bacterium]
MPLEMMVFTLCREMKCSPRVLREEYSPYEIRFFWDFLQEVWQHEKDEVEDAKRKQNRGA